MRSYYLTLLFIPILCLQVCSISAEVRSIFDIGTGKIKMQVARISDGGADAIYCESVRTSYNGVSLTNKDGEITEEGERSITAALGHLKQVSEAYQPNQFQAFATELFRSAPNGRQVAERISSALGIDIQIISSEQEGILSYLTVVQERGWGMGCDEIVVLDIGSGSFQFTYLDGSEFLVFGLPLGRVPTHALVRSGQLSTLATALSQIDPKILLKLQDKKTKVIGVGAHPKRLICGKAEYTREDLEEALLAKNEIVIDYTDLLLVKTIMETLSIEKIRYQATSAGNTSGFMLFDEASNCVADGSGVCYNRFFSY